MTSAIYKYSTTTQTLTKLTPSDFFNDSSKVLSFIMKRGRKKKQPTYTKTFRVDEILKNFLDSIENSNSFVVETLKDTIEFKEFLQHENSKQNQNQPDLF